MALLCPRIERYESQCDKVSAHFVADLIVGITDNYAGVGSLSLSGAFLGLSTWNVGEARALASLPVIQSLAGQSSRSKQKLRLPFACMPNLQGALLTVFRYVQT